MTKTTFIVVVILKVNWVKKTSPPLTENFPQPRNLSPPFCRQNPETVVLEKLYRMSAPAHESTLTEGVLA